MKTTLGCALLLGAAMTFGMAPPAMAEEILVSSSIQAAVDAASPGDTVVVPPGRYHETVTIGKSGITIRGNHGTVIDAAGFAVGIRATPGPGGPGCPASTLTDITVDDVRIENARFTGVLVRGVDGFTVRDGVYAGNEEYAIVPICSRNGVIEGNHVEGTDDAAIYVGNSHVVVVERNHATDSTVGIEIENSTGTGSRSPAPALGLHGSGRVRAAAARRVARGDERRRAGRSAHTARAGKPILTPCQLLRIGDDAQNGCGRPAVEPAKGVESSLRGRGFL